MTKGMAFCWIMLFQEKETLSANVEDFEMEDSNLDADDDLDEDEDEKDDEDEDEEDGVEETEW